MARIARADALIFQNSGFEPALRNDQSPFHPGVDAGYAHRDWRVASARSNVFVGGSRFTCRVPGSRR